MIEPENGCYRVSGEVIGVTLGQAVELSWAWHDRETGDRGHESRVRLAVRADGQGGKVLALEQAWLADTESARLYHEGWAYSLDRIDKLVTPAGAVP